MTHFKRCLLLALAILVLTSCQQDTEPTPTSAAPADTVAPTPLTPTAAVETPPTMEATTGPTTVPTLAVGELPEPKLFEISWDDRELFRDNLLESAQNVLNKLPGASVYHLDMVLSDDLTALEGRMEVRYTNREGIELQEVYFRLFPNLAEGRTEIESVTVNTELVDPLFELRDSAMRVPLPTPLQVGESVVVGIDFAVDVPTEGGGNYGTFVFNKDVLALAHFYPMIAVYDDEKWNVEIAPESGDVVYADSSFYVVRLSAPRGLQVVASGVVTSEDEDGNRQVTTYAAGPARDFYIAASKDYEVVSTEVDGITVNSYSFPEVNAASEAVLNYAVDSLETFNERLGPYPYTEFDVVGTPTLALGVEYPGIVAINMDLYDPEVSRYPPVVLESTVAHEVGHQWFYAIVGNDQLDDPWLDESLVQYITMLYFLDVYGLDAAAEFRDSLLRRWQAVDGADIPIGMPVAAYEGPEYSAIVYGRGPLFFETLQEQMGEEAFEAFLQDYYQTYYWEIATPEGLQELAEMHCSCDLDSFFAEWVFPTEG